MFKSAARHSLLAALFVFASTLGGHPALAGDGPVGLKTCDFTVGISRSDSGNGTWRSLSFTGPVDSAFSFQGCTTTSAAGQECVSKYGVSDGVRILANQDGQAVGEGVCCNDVQNAITSVTAQCSSRAFRPLPR